MIVGRSIDPIAAVCQSVTLDPETTINYFLEEIGVAYKNHQLKQLKPVDNLKQLVNDYFAK